jgi:thiamine monophosphate kinase
LEFGNLYMRVVKDGGQVLSGTAKTVSGVTRANPGVVTCTSHGFSDGDDVYVTGVVGMTQLNGRTMRVANKATHTFELNDYDGNNINTPPTPHTVAREQPKTCLS